MQEAEQRLLGLYCKSDVGVSDMLGFVERFRRDESGATAIEYALLAALIAVALVTGMRQVGNEVNGSFNTVANSFN